MEYFLGEFRRHKLIRDLMNVGLKRHMAESVASFPVGKHDDHLRAHAYACIKGVQDGGDQGIAFIFLSQLCMEAIQEEAVERGMDKSDFPTAAQVMDTYVAMSQAAKNGKKPH